MASFRLRILAQTLPFLLIAPGLAVAQAPPTRGEAMAALDQPAKPGAAQYTRQQIDQLVAPIALYPDQLLSDVLMAASYPQQVVEAAQWVQEGDHAAFKGDTLVAALDPLPWDPSVKALVPFPQILTMMSEHIEWTESLGIAFVTQQNEVMARVQALRHLAMKSGRLKKVQHLKVEEEGQAIVITEAEPGKIFIPVYNPTVVYGSWPDQGYPPIFLPPPQGFISERIEPGLEVSVGYTVAQPLWGWSRVDWGADRITIDRTEYTRITRNVEIGPGDAWRHNGPIVLVPAALASRTSVNVNVPAGTVAPAKAAAVTALPQRAAADPQRIKTANTEKGSGKTQPGQTTTNRSGSTQPERNQTRSNGAAANRPMQNQEHAIQPGGTAPGQAQSGSSRPEEGQNRANQFRHEQPGGEQSTAAPNERPNGQREAVGPQHGGEANENAAVKPSEREGAGSSGFEQPKHQPEHGGPGPAASQHQPPTQATEREGAGSSAFEQPRHGPEHGGPTASQHQPPAQATGREGSGSSAFEQSRHEPEHGEPAHEAGQPSAAAKTPGAEPRQAQGPQHPGSPAQTEGQGSSMPPAPGGPPHPAPSAQTGHGAPGPHPPGRPEDNGNKEH